MIPPDSLEAYESVRQGAWVRGLTELNDIGEKGCEFEFELSTPQPNREALPTVVRFRAILPSSFPNSKAEIYILNKANWRFPHMTISNGHLCLKFGGQHVWDPAESLFQTLFETVDWLEDAARGTLLQPESPWELPDFRVDPLKGSPPPIPVWISESPRSFEPWSRLIGSTGEVILRINSTGKALIPTQFLDTGGDPIPSPQPDPSFLSKREIQIRGIWILLPSLIYESHRPPRTLKELESMCQKSGIYLWDSIGASARLDSARQRHYVLIGAPIPEMVGGKDAEIHWQPIVVPSKWVTPAKFDRGGKPKRVWMRDTLGEVAIPWGESQNISPTRLGARGWLGCSALGLRASLVGCGALGSMLVEHLIRGGMGNLALFDGDVLEPGNLCRHTLAPADIDQPKAVALAEKFRGLCPEFDIRGYHSIFPLPPPFGFSKPWREILESNVWIDCTAHEATFIWLSQQGRARGKRVIHLFTNPHAKMLTVILSGKHTTCAQVNGMLLRDIWQGRAPFSLADFFPKTKEVPIGAGCWHPAFPAIGSDLQALVASAVPVIAAFLDSPWPSCGRAVVLRRNDFTMESGIEGPAPLVEVCLNRPYRWVAP